MNLIWDWITKHWSSVGMGLLLSWLTIGGTYVFFIKPSTKISVGSGGTYVAASEGFQPSIGCASGRQFFGLAHKK